MLPPSDKNDLIYIDNPTKDDFKTHKCVHFSDYENYKRLKTAFNSSLTSNLRKRLMFCTGSLSQKRLRILERLKMEHELKVLKLKLEHGNLDDNYFCWVEDALPCTLHMENRLGFSSLNLLFLEGHGNYDNRSLFDAPFRGLPGRWKEFVSSVTSIIDKVALGTEEN